MLVFVITSSRGVARDGSSIGQQGKTDPARRIQHAAAALAVAAIRPPVAARHHQNTTNKNN